MAAVAMGIFLATIDGSIVNVALPTLVAELNASFATVQWVVLAYLLTLATLLPSVGRLADMRGKKSIYVYGLGVFTVGSVLCGLAPTVGWLIAMRVVQAVGAAMILALGQAILTEAFPPSERGRALGISGAIVSIGIITGPTLGGLILGSLSWHWIFFVNLPVGILGVWIAMRSLPKSQPRGGQVFDIAGAAALFVALFALLMALTLGQGWGFGNVRILAMFAVAIGALFLFIAIERRVAQPVVDLNLFRNREFSVNIVTALIVFIAMSGTILLLPFYLEGIRGYAVAQVGIILAVTPICVGIVSPYSGAMSDRFGTRRITVIGLSILLVGFGALSTLRMETPLWAYVLRMIPVGIGLGVFQSPNNSAILGAAPSNRLGVASGLLALTRTMGQSMGIAVSGALWAAGVVLLMGVLPAGGAPSAPPEIQIVAMARAFGVAAALVAIALMLASWAWWREVNSGRRAVTESVQGAPE
jgi:EmrB/QacA subfamily drug resistance transporter